MSQMQLKEIYQPIARELADVERVLSASMMNSKSQPILKIGDYLLDVQGKRLRPALVILSAKATLEQKPKDTYQQLTKIASSIELIHMASLIHDDVIDHACLRHNKPTINQKFGQEASIVLGDYLYSIGFELISSSRNPDMLSCIACATKAMCEGELIQVCERDNLELLKKRYIMIAKKKTASLFIASNVGGWFHSIWSDFLYASIAPFIFFLFSSMSPILFHGSGWRGPAPQECTQLLPDGSA